MAQIPSFDNAAKRKLAAGGLVLCMGVRQARTADFAMIASSCGFDSFYVDMEHSPISHETASMLCVAAIGVGLTPIVRVPSHQGDDATRILDGGAQGLIVPHVNNREEAQAMVEACKYPPLGRRSVAGTGPAHGYRPLSLAEINQRGNDETLLVFMLETAEGIANVEAIATVPGIDVLLIGSNDLCTEFGIPGQLRHAKLREAHEAVAAACRKHGKILGLAGLSSEFELQQQFIGMGARFVMTGSEIAYLMAAARKDVERMRTIKLG
jgi:2-keto-3-deoxy-L-rhamnonate aldolase RhmA